MPEDPVSRSPTETLIHCLEDFGETEPHCVLVIWKNKDDLCWSRDSNLSLSEAVGMLECIKTSFLESWQEQRKE